MVSRGSLVSGVGEVTQVPRALDAFRAQNEGWSFNLVHAWLKLHNDSKWIDLLALLKKQAKNQTNSGKKKSNDQSGIDVEEGETSSGFGLRSNRPRRKNLSKEDVKREASTISACKNL
jgi:hypothetical protein